jgi:hypothetical protein
LSSQGAARRDAAATAQATRRQQFLTQLPAGFEDLDTPEAVEAYLKLQSAQGATLGINEQDVRAMAPPASALQVKAAKKKLKELDGLHGAKLMEMGPQFTYRLPGEPEPVTFDQLLERAGQAKDPNYQAPPPDPAKLETRGLDVQAADALAKGDTATYQRLLRVKKEMGAADDRPPDPTLQAIRNLTLQQAQALKQNGGMNPAQFSQSQALANDYQAQTKNFWTQRSAYEQILAANPSQTSPAGHMALVFGYMKLLDPNSVVRETEYANAQNATGVPDQIRNLYNKVIDGAILTPRQIQDFRNQAKSIYLGSKREAIQKKAIFDQRATAQGLRPEAVTYMLDDPTFTAPKAETTTAAPGAGKNMKVGRFEVTVEP